MLFAFKELPVQGQGEGIRVVGTVPSVEVGQGCPPAAPLPARQAAAALNRMILLP